MKERPISFKGEMVRAILDNRKTMTRRIINPQPLWVADPSVPFKTKDADPKGVVRCPYGKPGDRLWVRETWRQGYEPTSFSKGIVYRADHAKAIGMDEYSGRHKWKPSIYMPRWASRITLEITNVRVERLQDISEEDAKSEGIEKSDRFENTFMTPAGDYASAKIAFMRLWESINGSRSWNENPWVWVVEFKRVNK